MKGLLVGVGAIFGLGLILILFYMGAYNGLVSRQENVNEKWSQVQNDYQRRADLIPNLVNTVKGVAQFEKDTLREVVEARARVGSIQMTPEILNNPQQFKQFEAAQGQLTQALSRLMVVVEKYPDIKATANFSELQSQLEGTENRITVARRDFNLALKEYNTSVRSFPTSVIAGMSGFKEKAYFEATAGSEKAPEVKF
ncbi:MAG: LemA family protein [Oligoflexia bacterium]|nr:LemA family protein [Oligoflexia bacterium]